MSNTDKSNLILKMSRVLSLVISVISVALVSIACELKLKESQKMSAFVCVSIRTSDEILKPLFARSVVDGQKRLTDLFSVY